MLTGEEGYSRKAVNVLRLVRDAVERYPSAFGYALGAMDFYLSTPKEVVVVSPSEGGADDARALAVMLAGESVTADEALASGLVNRVVGEGEVENAAIELANRIGGFAPLAVRACLRAVTEGAHLELARGLELEAELFAQLFSTEDVREGTSAFLEKRKPDFKGKCCVIIDK